MTQMHLNTLKLERKWRDTWNEFLKNPSVSSVKNFGVWAMGFERWAWWQYRAKWRERQLELARCLCALWKRKKNLHTERTCRLTTLVLKLHISFYHCHQEPWGKADFITSKSSQAVRKVVQNIVSHVIELQIFYYRCNDIENGLINFCMLLI